MYRVFGWQHFLLLAIAIGIVLVMVLFLRKLTDRTRKIVQISIISALGLFLVLEYVGRILMLTDFKVIEQLPLNIHQIFVFISIVIFFINKASWIKFAYLIITPVSAYGLLFTPEVYSLGSGFSLAVVSYVIINALLIGNSILNLLWSEEELEKKDILDASIMFVIFVAAIHIFNIVLRFSGVGIHANYFGTMGDGYDILIGWLHSLMPVTATKVAVPLLCIIPLIAVLVGVQFLLVLPFQLVSLKRQHQENLEELIALGNLKKQQEARAKTVRRTKSQILVNSSEKAKPKEQKNVYNSTQTGFVATNKEIKVNKDYKE